MKNLIAMILAFSISLQLSAQLAFNDSITKNDWFDDLKSYEMSESESETILSEETQEIDLSVDDIIVEDLKFKITMNLDDIVEIRLYDTDGQQIRNLRTASLLNAGASAFMEDVTPLKSGTYILVIYTPGWTTARTISKI